MTPSDIQIAPAGPAHAPVLAELHRRCFHSAGWSPTEMLAMIEAFGAFGLLAVLEDEPVGLALARVAADEGEVLALGVPAERRRRGIGRALLSALADRCAEHGASRLFLEVACDNAAAQALYASHGFVIVGRRPGYYVQAAGGAVDGLVLAKAVLKPSAAEGDAEGAGRPPPQRQRDAPAPSR